MNKLITIVLIFMMINTSWAACDWSTITKNGDSYVYSKDCHIEVGKLVKESELREEQVAKLNKALELKDLALTTAETRVNNWRDTTYSLEKRLQTQRKWSVYNDWMYFGGGVALTILSVWAAGQIK